MQMLHRNVVTTVMFAANYVLNINILSSCP